VELTDRVMHVLRYSSHQAAFLPDQASGMGGLWVRLQRAICVFCTSEVWPAGPQPAAGAGPCSSRCGLNAASAIHWLKRWSALQHLSGLGSWSHWCWPSPLLVHGHHGCPFAPEPQLLHAPRLVLVGHPVQLYHPQNCSRQKSYTTKYGRVKILQGLEAMLKWREQETLTSSLLERSA